VSRHPRLDTTSAGHAGGRWVDTPGTKIRCGERRQLSLLVSVTVVVLGSTGNGGGGGGDFVCLRL
jgi:hypothetical protein